MIPSWSFAHILILLRVIIEQLPHLCTCPVLPDPLFPKLIKNAVDVLFRQMAFNLFRASKILKPA
jgi:hypothetical protein